MGTWNDYSYADDAPAPESNMDDDFEMQAREYLTSPDYKGPSFTTGDGQSWGGYSPEASTQDSFSNEAPASTPWGSSSYAPNSAMFNLMGQTNPNMSMPQTSNFTPQAQGQSSNWDTSGVQNVLANLFNNKGFVSGLGALMEGRQNKQKAAMTQQMVRQMQPAMDPFGAQRGQYQQELTRTMQDPYSAPIVAQQVEQLKRAQAIKDAAAGRRSNSATTDPALMAAMAGVAQKYMDSLYTPAGANINPSGLSSLISAIQQGNNADINGYISPLLSAVG